MPCPNTNAFVNAKGICKNCLSTSHTMSECKSQKTCFKCGRRHHTLLHKDDSNPSKLSQSQTNTNSNQFSRPVQARTFVTHLPQSPQNHQPPQRFQPPQNFQPVQNFQLAQNPQPTHTKPNQNSQLVQNVHTSQGPPNRTYTTSNSRGEVAEKYVQKYSIGRSNIRYNRKC